MKNISILTELFHVIVATKFDQYRSFGSQNSHFVELLIVKFTTIDSLD